MYDKETLSQKYWHIENGGMSVKILKYDNYIQIRFESSYCDFPSSETTIHLGQLSNSDTLKRIAQVFTEAANKIDSEKQVDK